MAIIKKVPAFQTPDGQFFASEGAASRHMFDSFVTHQLHEGRASLPSQAQLDALWNCRFDLAKIILEMNTSAEPQK